MFFRQKAYSIRLIFEAKIQKLLKGIKLEEFETLQSYSNRFFSEKHKSKNMLYICKRKHLDYGYQRNAKDYS